MSAFTTSAPAREALDLADTWHRGKELSDPVRFTTETGVSVYFPD